MEFPTVRRTVHALGCELALRLVLQLEQLSSVRKLAHLTEPPKVFALDFLRV